MKTPFAISRRRVVTTGLVGLAALGGPNWSPLSAAARSTYTSFRPGQPWLDDAGNTIQAHGGQVVARVDADGSTIYYWYGEDRSNGYHDSPGVHVYSSVDLYNWTDKGLALRAMSSPDQFETDPYFSALYADYSTAQKEAVYRDLGTHQADPAVNPAILERPKVIYNAHNDQWVLWVHADGPSETSNAQYAKAKAGVAVSDSPTGPFRYIDSYRLHVAPEGEPNYDPDNPGMARDMNLFVDDDATAYIIYSSEENYSLFISKLDEDYTSLATPPDDAVKGVDFIRPYIGAHREAPAIFRYDDTYYLITSGATGWDPNPATYATATSILGEWTDHGNPISGPGAGNTHSSQSTSVITVDRDAGRFVFMGDRWTPSDLANAPYVWLPISFGEGNSLILGSPTEWTLDDLAVNIPYTVDVQLPEHGWLGEADEQLPETVRMTSRGSTRTTAVTWEAKSLGQPGIRPLVGTLPELDGKSFQRNLLVIPRNLAYVVNSGGQQTADWTKIIKLARIQRQLLNSVPDQPLGSDAGTTWGYASEGSLPSGAASGNLYTTLRYAVSRRPIDYTFSDLPRGDYTVHVGYYDPWPWANRAGQVSVNDAVVDDERLFTATEEVGTYPGIQVGAEGTITLSIMPTRSPDIQVSWVMVARAG